MGRVAFIFTSTLMTWLLVAALAHATSVHLDSVEGFQTASTESQGVNLLLNAEGDLPGVNKVVLRRDGNNVIGGSWTLTVLPPNADATSVEKGKLTGSVSGGTLTFNGDGALTRADSIQLIIDGGSGQYSGVRSGTGTIKLASRPDNPSQLAGTLTLNF